MSDNTPRLMSAAEQHAQYDRIIVAGAALTDACHTASANAGWWQHHATGINLRDMVRDTTGDPLTRLLASLVVTQKLCLVHSEVSEGMEGHRKGLQDDKLPHRPMLEVELADAIIRIFDLAGAMQLDLGGAIAEKLAFNAVRLDHTPAARAAANGKTF